MTISVIKLGKHMVGAGQPPFTVAELACAHEGDFEYARRMVDEAIGAGASAIKFQVFTADGLVVPSHSLYKAYRRFEFSERQWVSLAKQARQGGAAVLIDVFEMWSLKIADRVEADGLKVHSTGVTNPYLLKAVAQARRPVLVGTGGTRQREIKAAVAILRLSRVPVLLVHGFQGYPTPVSETHLKRLATLARQFKAPVGFACHADGAGDLALWQCLVALGLGCSLFELHFILQRLPQRTDYHSSLEPSRFRQVSDALGQMAAALGLQGYAMGEAEKAYRRTFKSYIVSAADLPAGHRLKVADFAFKRADDGLLPSRASAVLGRRLARAVRKDEPITPDMVRDKDDKK